MTHHKNIILLLDDYAGKVSEMTAVCQYFHHYFVVNKPDVAELLEEVAVQEMLHKELLGKELVAAGIDPRFYDSRKRYWVGNYVNYQYNVCSILQADIIAELEAIHQYYQHIQAIPISRVQMLLHKIIKDEVLHVQMFLEKLAKYCPTTNPHNWLVTQINKLGLDPKHQSELNSMLQKD